MATLYIHIGTPKTATTAIQTFCENNREALKLDGFYFPEFEYKYPDIPKWTPDNPYMQEDIIRYFGEVTMLQQKKIMELQEMVMDLKKENQRLNRRIDRITEAVKHPVKAVRHFVKK